MLIVRVQSGAFLFFYFYYFSWVVHCSPEIIMIKYLSQELISMEHVEYEPIWVFTTVFKLQILYAFWIFLETFKKFGFVILC